MTFVNPLLEAIRKGTAPKMIKTAAAKGALPLPPEILLESQMLLTSDKDEQVRQAAQEGLRGYATEDVVLILESKTLPAPVLSFCADFFKDRPQALEKIILNPNTENATFAAIAARASQSLAELIIANQVRLIEHPDILYRLRENPSLSPGNRQRLDEIERDFFGAAPTAAFKTVPPAPPVEPPPPAEPLPEAAAPPETPPPSEVVEEEDEERESTPSPEEVEFIEETAAGDQQKLTMLQKLAKLPVSGKIKAALLGNREVRSLLVRDSNRLVATTVLVSPKITESEIELFSQLRNVNDEVLRLIGHNRGWTKNYKIGFNLVKNPRAPMNITLPLISRLTTLDLKMLQRDKSVPDGIRQQAKRLLGRRLGGEPGERS